MAKLVCQAGHHAGYEFALPKDRTVFGRQSSCDVQIMDGMASREHFLIRRDGKLFTLVDLESRNGTKVNGRKVSERQLEFGDKIRVGDAEFVFVKEGGDVEIRDLLTKKYEVVEKIGEGGMGIVYKARQRSMDRMVALKVLAPKYAARPRFVQQFIDEARAAGRLNHPNIIQVHDVDSENGIHYFSMEFVEGATCMRLLSAQGVFTQEEALEIGRLTAKALQYAHEQHIIHRDVKPDNIMIGINETVKLADLGISKTFEEAEAEGKPKKVVGTPHYMAPEAALGHKIDHRIDVYALGATLYHLLTNRTPFTGTTVTDVLKSTVKDEPPPVRTLNATVHVQVEQLVAKMMAKDPDRRIGSCQAVIDEIQRLQAEGVLAQPAPGGETVMLKRFASGRPAPAADDEPARPTGPRTDRPSGAGATRARPGTTARPDGQPGLAVVRILLTLVIVGLAAALAVVVATRVMDQTSSSKPSPGAGTTTSSSSGSDGPAQARPTPVPASSSSGSAAADAQTEASRRALADLERLLAASPEAAALPDLRRRLDALAAGSTDAGIAARLEDLRRRLLEREQAQANAGDTRAWAAKKEAVADLVAQRDFDAALEQVRGFAVGKPEPVPTEAARLEREITAEKAAFLEGLRHRVRQAVTMKDATRLRELRNGLPLSLAGSDIEKEIAQALAEIDQASAARAQQVVAEAQGLLRDWRLDDLREFHDRNRRPLGDGASGKDLDRLLQHSEALRDLIQALDEHLRRLDRKPRVKGMLYAYREPDLAGASIKGLVLATADGGTAVAPWGKLPAEELDTVLALVLADDQIERWKPVLAAVRAAPAAPAPAP